VLLTNPAYSGDHIPKLLDICCAGAAPFLLLMPNWVAAKDYYAAAQARHPVLKGALYWWPRKRYVYWTPQGLRDKKQAHASAAGNRTSPFPSFWYLGLGPHRAAAAAALQGLRGGPACGLSFSVGELPPGVRPAEAPGGGGGGGGSGDSGGGAAGDGGAAWQAKKKKHKDWQQQPKFKQRQGQHGKQQHGQGQHGKAQKHGHAHKKRPRPSFNAAAQHKLARLE
jgi:hypothetical protein